MKIIFYFPNGSEYAPDISGIPRKREQITFTTICRDNLSNVDDPLSADIEYYTLQVWVVVLVKWQIMDKGNELVKIILSPEFSTPLK